MLVQAFTALAVVASVAVAAHIPSPLSNKFSIRDLQPESANLPSPWKYLGCYSDNVAARVLHKAFFASDVSMRGQICISFCDDNGYTFAGTEWSRECFCGLELPSAAVSYPDDCTMECTGSDGESCGGSNRLTVYSKGPPDPQTDVGGSSYTYLGCYTDIVSERTLPYLADVPGGSGAMTVSACTGTCYSLGYTIGGLEFAGECWCGNTIPASSSIVLGSSFASGCDMLCRGNRSEFCGGPDRLNLYQLGSSGSESTEAPTPPAPTSTSPSPDSSTSLATSTASTAQPTRTNILKNGDFELDDTSWSTTSNPINGRRGNLQGRRSIPQRNDAYEGAYNWWISDPPQADGFYSICLSQSANHPLPGTYTFSAYIGRSLVGFTEDRMTYDVFVDSERIVSGPVCEPFQAQIKPCTVGVGEASHNGYDLVTMDVPLTSDQVGSHTLSICANYKNVGFTQGDDFIVDNVEVLAPL